MLGYIGLISEEELERYGEDVYDLNDKIGKVGLERVYERYFWMKWSEIGLRGKKELSR